MPEWVRRGLRGSRVAGLLLVGAMLLAGCAGAGTDAGADARGASAAGETSEAAIRITPGDGAAGVLPVGPLAVTVDRGTLTRVRVVDADGSAVTGTIGPGRRSWRLAGRLALEARYTVDVLAQDARGRQAAKHAVFTTLVPRHRLIGYYSPESGATVGTGMIVTIVFNRPVADRAAVERAVTVVASPSVPVAGHWFGSRRVDFRPAHHWAPGTRVEVRLRLRDVPGAPGVYGSQHRDVVFTIGRSQRSVVDAAAHTMTVRRAGRVVRTLPISAGSTQHATYDGIMVISEKLPVTRMDGDTVGYGGEYNIPDVPHALRLTRSGTFVHGNYWAQPGTFGTANTSHGCIGLYDVKGGGEQTPAGWFFAHSLVGDIVQVIHSPERTVAADNGMGGWNLSWAQWIAGSALH